MELVPFMLSLAALAAITVVLWRLRRTWPPLLAGWTAYLLLLAPVMGLTPSGQTATADRYMYVPGVVLSFVASLAIVQVVAFATAKRLVLAAAAALALMMGLQTWQQTQWWHDSVSLWTRALVFDSRNDIATFNLAVALDNDGRKDEAMARYEQTLALIPEHEPARRSLTNLRAERGLARLESGQPGEAVADLRAALAQRPDDLVLANALSYSLIQSGRAADAVAVLKQSLAHYPDNDELAHNLARLLATSSDAAVRDGTLALRLALAVRERTGGRDPRVLDTLAAAFAAAGQQENARKASIEAAALARKLGDEELAREIASHEWAAR
jgi:Flp pilus assembly protein TadD